LHEKIQDYMTKKEDYKFEVGQPVYDICGCSRLNQILIIRERYRDWNLETFSTDNPTTKNMYIVGEWGCSDDGPGSAMHYAECNLQAWTYDDAAPDTAIVLKTKDNTDVVGIIYSHIKNIITFYVYAAIADSSEAIADNTIEFRADNLRIPEPKEIQMLAQKMKESGLEWDTNTKTVKKTRKS